MHERNGEDLKRTWRQSFVLPIPACYDFNLPRIINLTLQLTSTYQIKVIVDFHESYMTSKL
jgi:hypothetical protein